MNFDRLRTGQMVAGISGVLLFIFEFFFKWYGIHLSAEEQRGLNIAKGLGVNIPATSVNAWHSLSVIRWVILLTAIIAVASAVVVAMDNAPAIPVSMSVLTTGAGALSAVLILYRIINQPGPNDLVDVKVGVWLGLLAAIGVAVGGYMSMQDEGATFGDFRTPMGAPPPTPPPVPPTPPPPAAPPPPTAG
jgi:hypothetical protein